MRAQRGSLQHWFRGARRIAALTVALLVLSMVVVGGLVGGQALGYDVVAGFSQGQLYGKGLAAGIAIVLLGIMLDRIARAAADNDPTPPEGIKV